jgi:hypothetical protein
MTIHEKIKKEPEKAIHMNINAMAGDWFLVSR